MEQIGTIVRQSLASKKHQQLSPDLLRKTNQLLCKYPTQVAVLNALSPSRQNEWCHDEALCYRGNFPTLTLLKASYGNNAPIAWLIPQLLNLSEFCGCKDKMSCSVMEECATIIAKTWHYLKVSELMLFFYRFKQGRYGRFYGSVDPLVITTALNDFITERNAALNSYEREELQKATYDTTGAITYEEYQERKKKKQVCNT